MALLKSNPPKPSPTLEDKIQALRDEIDLEIDRRAEEIKATMPGVPLTVVRSILVRNNTCQCAAFLRIKESEA